MAEKTLLLPLELDALYLEEGISVVDNLRLNELPYFNGKRDVNADNPNLSETIISQPFQNRNTFLKPGLHLHWFLPSAMMEGKVSEQKMEYSAVPNRWLVIKATRQGEEERNFERWLVESDYLHDPKSGYIESAVPLPLRYPYSDAQEKELAPPFCFVGRTVRLDSINSTPPARKGKYISDIPDTKLTAMSGGSFEFPLIYPYCRSLFGFHDPTGTTDPQSEYYVLGWNEDRELDNLESLISDLEVEEEVLNNQAKSLNDVIKNHLGWKLSDELLDRKGISKIVCFSHLKFSHKRNTSINHQDATVQLAVANTKEEALCAYLAQRLKAKQNPEFVEQQLGLLNCSGDIDNYDIDKKTSYEIKKHFEGFYALPGNDLWKIEEELPQKLKQEQSHLKEEFVLPDNLVETLCRLNQKQEAVFQTENRLRSLRYQLFVDWYKYMMSAYPLEDGLNQYPDADTIKGYLESILIDKEIQPLESERNRLKNQASDLKKNLEVQLKIEGELGRTLTLVSFPAPRFWAPKEPTVMLLEESMMDGKSNILTPVSNCGQMNEIRGLLINRSFEAIIDNETSLLDLLDQLDSEPEQEGESNQPFGRIIWEHQPWKPFLLAWALEIAAPSWGNNQTTEDLDYDPNYVTENYVLEEQSFDLTPKTKYKVRTEKYDRNRIRLADSNVYSGICILTSDSNDSLRDRLLNFELTADPEENQEVEHPLYTQLIAYIKRRMENYPRDYQVENYIREYLPRRFDLYTDFCKKDENDHFASIENLEKIKHWFEEEEGGRSRSSILSLQSVLKMAKDELDGLACLSQSLGGFNESLLMKKETLQLAINEPLGFENYQEFTRKVRDHVMETDAQGNNTSLNNKSAPLPLNVFSPIRAGKMDFIGLELIDTFGRVRKLRWEETITPTNMKGETAFPIDLPPRLVQAARIDFKFLRADQHQFNQNRIANDACHDKTTTPICGWIIPDNLNDSLLIYDGGGEILGSINLNSEWSVVPGKTNYPQKSNRITNDQVPNLHLRKVVNHILKIGKERNDVDQLEFLKHFSLVLNNALQNINPEGHKSNEGIALFVGRPIAVVRAVFNLELQETPAANQDWQNFEYGIQNDIPFDERDRDRFSSVKFLIRIGNYQKLNDGIIGYWKEAIDADSEGGYGYENNLFFAQQSDAIESQFIETQYWDPKNLDYEKTESPINLQQSLDDIPQTVTILMDPSRVINISSGILPTKEIKMPENLYKAVLHKMQVSLLISPLLTMKGAYNLPLPNLAGIGWSWLEKSDNHQWREIDQTPFLEKETFFQFASFEQKEACWEELLKKEWIKEGTEKPLFIASALQKKPSELKGLDEQFTDFQEEVLDILKRRSQFLSTSVDMEVVAATEIKEGWLLPKKAKNE
jgi:hypothetical protein